MFDRTRWFTCLVMLLSIVSSLFLTEVQAETSRKNVVVLNSYDFGNPFSDAETKGVLQVLNTAGLDLNIQVEYMDWKKHPDQQRLKLLAEDYKLKYRKKIDLLITQDDMALDFALKHRKDLFYDAPVVFCGVNEVSQRLLLANQQRVTGVIEDCDPEGTLRAALAINPDIKNLYLIHDNSESGLATAEMTMEAVLKLKPSLAVYPLNTLSLQEIYDKVHTLTPDSIVLYTVYFADNNGVGVDTNEVCQQVSSFASVPVYHLYDFALGHGIIGGSLTSGEKHGQTAGQLAAGILSGTSMVEVPLSREKNTQLIFDYQELKRFAIDVSRLPFGSVVINKPFSFYETYKNLVHGVIVAFVMLVAFIMVLLTNIRRRVTAEKTLKTANEELNLLYEEIAASEEELRGNYQELSEKQEALIKSEERYALAVNGANDVVWDYDIRENTLYLSERFYDLLGYMNEELNTVEKFMEIVHPEDKALLNWDRLYRPDGENAIFREELRLQHKNREYQWTLIRGKILVDNEPIPVRIAGSLTDITELKENEYTMQYMAYHDALTGLKNRIALHNEFANLDEQDMAVLMLLDLDNFKNINDTLGHNYGDEVLVEVGRRLESLADKETIVARFGGDEFVILQRHIVPNYTNTVAEKILRELQAPIYIDTNIVTLGASMGIACFPKDGITFDEVCRNADTAMYDAKAKGRKQISFFEPIMKERLTDRITLETALCEAIEKDEFVLQYQPQVDMQNGKICGLEALVRWVRPGIGIVYPGDFIPLSEETGLIVPLGKLVLEKALQFAARLRNLNCPMCVGVNVSMIQFNQPDFVSVVLDAIERAGVRGPDIGIEITETVFMDNFAQSVAKIEQLRSRGVEIYLDDFGTGYSSFKYLKKLPIDKLKIDKTFIDDIAKGQDDIIETVVILAHKMGMKVVAEGVEYREQFELLNEYACDMIQGYYISKPVFADSILPLIKRLNGMAD